MNIQLTPEMEQLVQRQVRTGRYGSPSELLREALQLLEDKDAVRSVPLQELRGRMDAALAEGDRGEGTDGEAFMQELLDDLDQPPEGIHCLGRASRQRSHSGEPTLKAEFEETVKRFHAGVRDRSE